MSESLVLLPTYNELENLPRVVPRLAALEEEVDVLVIDDASPDGTGSLAEELKSRYPRLSVLHRRGKEGLGRAYLHGFKVALQEGYRRIVTMDADLSHAPEDVPRLLGALEEADVAIGSRHVPGGGVEDWPVSRRFLSRAGSLYARALLWLRVSDATSGFRAYRAEALREIDLERLHAQGFVFQVEILRRLLDLPGARAVEVPILFRNRARGASKLSRGIVLEAVREVSALAFRERGSLKRPYEPLARRRLPPPRVSVIIPARPGPALPSAVGSLEELGRPGANLEVVLARGRSPSRQRNLAVQATTGDYILFLDDDSQVTGSLLETYVKALERDPTVAAVGGPATFLPGSRFQDVASLVLADPWVTGRNASRYSSRGAPRFTDERELILCNLCVRREAFEAAGGFNEELYPNEENELLERLRLLGWRLVHRPEAVVMRPQRESLGEFLRAIGKYGVGRSSQARCLFSRVSIGRLGWVSLGLLALVVGTGGLWRGSWAYVTPLFIYGLYLGALGLRFTLRTGVRAGVWAAVLAALLHGCYLLGVLAGLLLPRRASSEEQVTLERFFDSRTLDRSSMEGKRG